MARFCVFGHKNSQQGKEKYKIIVKKGPLLKVSVVREKFKLILF